MKRVTHFVLDLETLAVSSNALILSIGAVAVTEKLEIIGSFSRNVDFKIFGSSYDVEPSTLDFWLSPAQYKALGDLQNDRVPLATALNNFAKFVEEFSGEENLVWGYGADFDISILKNSFDKEGVNWPFKFYNHRCLRTLVDHYNVASKLKLWRQSGTHHNALIDATNQAYMLIEILRQSKISIISLPTKPPSLPGFGISGKSALTPTDAKIGDIQSEVTDTYVTKSEPSVNVAAMHTENLTSDVLNLGYSQSVIK